MISRLLFGEDLFISYSRLDGRDYAAGLADELTKLKFSCFMDQLGSEPSKDLPNTLRSKIRRSTILVLVGTQGALASPYVKEELEEFKKTKRTIVPIYFDEVPKDSPLDAIIPGLVSWLEEKESLKAGTPSQRVISSIVKSFNYSRRNEKLRRMVWVTVISVTLLLVGAVSLSAFIIRRANEDAQRARDEAQAALTRAQTAEAEAVKANNEAQNALTIANQQRDQALFERAQRHRAESRRR